MTDHDEDPYGQAGRVGGFIDLLYKHQHSSGSQGIRSQTRAALQHYGRGALTRADQTLTRLPDLIAGMAAERHAG